MNKVYAIFGIVALVGVVLFATSTDDESGGNEIDIQKIKELDVAVAAEPRVIKQETFTMTSVDSKVIQSSEYQATPSSSSSESVFANDDDSFGVPHIKNADAITPDQVNIAGKRYNIDEYNYRINVDASGNLFIDHSDYISIINTTTNVQTTWTNPDGVINSGVVDSFGYYYYLAFDQIVRFDHTTNTFTEWDIPIDQRYGYGGERNYILDQLYNHNLDEVFNFANDIYFTRDLQRAEPMGQAGIYVSSISDRADSKRVHYSTFGTSGPIQVDFLLPNGEVGSTNTGDRDHDNDGIFSSSFSLNKNIESGTYTLRLQDRFQNVTTTFELNPDSITHPRPSIPEYVSKTSFLQKFSPDNNTLTEYFTDNKMSRFNIGELGAVDSEGALYFAIGVLQQHQALGSVDAIPGIMKVDPNTELVTVWSDMPSISSELTIHDRNAYFFTNNDTGSFIAEFNTETNMLREWSTGELLPSSNIITDSYGNVFFVHLNLSSTDSLIRFVPSTGIFTNFDIGTILGHGDVVLDVDSSDTIYFDDYYENRVYVIPSALEGEVELGAVISLTGGIATIGNEVSVAANLAVADFNEHLAGMGQDWRLKLVVEDSETDPGVALEKLTSLNDQGIKTVVGVETSAIVRNAKPYADDNNMLLISCCSTAPALAFSGDSVYRVIPDDRDQGVALSQLMRTTGIDAVVPVWRADVWGDGLENSASTAFEGRGGVFIEGVRYNTDTTEFSTVASLLAEKVSAAVAEHGVDNVAVLILGFSETLDIIQSASAHDILDDVSWFGPGAISREAIYVEDPAGLAFTTSTNLTTVQVGLSDNPIHQKVRQHFIDTSGSAPSIFAYPAYDSVWLAGLSMLETQSTSTTQLKKVFHTVADAHSGAVGNIELNEAGDLAHADYEVWGVRNGGWEELGLYHHEDDSVEFIAVTSP